MSTTNPRSTLFVNRRRSQRILLSIAVQISGMNKGGEPFSEETKTEAVNSHGAMITLRAVVSEGQPLKMKSLMTGEEVRCVVANIALGAQELKEVGIEFKEPNPRFWRVSFPPPDWSPRWPEAKRFGNDPVSNASQQPPAKK